MLLKNLSFKIAKSLQICCELIILLHLGRVGHVKDDSFEPLNECISVVCYKFGHVLFTQVSTQLQYILVDIW